MVDTKATSRTLFSYENIGSTAREFSRKCETLRCENSTLAIIARLLLINGIDATILWAGLAKRSRHFVAARDFYDARRTFYASSCENLVEKSARHASSLPRPAISVSVSRILTSFSGLVS